MANTQRKFVDQAALSLVLVSYNAKVITKIKVESDRAIAAEDTLRASIDSINTTQIEANKQAIIEINDADSGILANAKKYTDAQITLVKGLITALETKVTSNTTKIEELESLAIAQGTKITSIESEIGTKTVGDTPATGIHKKIEDLEAGIGNIDMSGAINQSKTYTDTKISELINGAGEAYDTLKELADAIDSNKNIITQLQEIATNKADKIHTHAPSDITGLKTIATTSNYNDLEVKATTSDIPYTNVMYPKFKTLADAMDKLLYVAPNINSFTSNPSGGTFEMGKVINSPIKFDWIVNKSLTTLTFDGTSLDVNAKTATYSGADISADKSFRLTISDGTNSVHKDLSFIFRHYRYWGVQTIPGTYDSAFIRGLTSKEFATGKAKSEFNITAGPNQYVYYCFPTSWGTPTFNVGGFDGGFEKAATINFVNQSSDETSFDIWKSQNADLGFQKIKIS